MPTLEELDAAGYDGLGIYCRRCRLIVVRWWSTLVALRGTDLEAVKGRLRCGRCRERPLAEDVQAYYRDTGSADGRRPPEPRRLQTTTDPTEVEPEKQHPT